MKTRKITMGLAALALMGAMILPVSAAESKDTTLTAEVPSTYTLTIPAATTITYGNTSTDLSGKLKVTGNVLPSQSVTVTADAKPLRNAVQNTDLPYTLENASGSFTTASWSEAELRSGLGGDGMGKEIQLSVKLKESDWNQAKAGTYSGSIVFTADSVTQ